MAWHCCDATVVLTAADDDARCTGCIVDEVLGDCNMTDSPGSSMPLSSLSLDGVLLSHATGFEREPASP